MSKRKNKGSATGSRVYGISVPDGGIDPRFEDAWDRSEEDLNSLRMVATTPNANLYDSRAILDAVHLEPEERRSPLGGDARATNDSQSFSSASRNVLISFALRPTTGDVVCGFEIVSRVRRPPQTTEQMEALVASGYGRKEDKRVMITLSSGSNSFGERVAATEVLLDWTDWMDSPAVGLNRFVPFDRSGKPVWFPTCALSMGNAKLHLLVGESLAAECDFYVLVRSLLSDGLRRATEKGKCWKLLNGKELVYNAHAKPGGQLRVE